MRIYALTVGKNEEHRYLSTMLNNTAKYVDGHFFYDDRSTDRTADIALNAGCTVSVRDEDRPSFLVHEGLFRSNAWHQFEDAMAPGDGDWVLVIDCDEMFMDLDGGSYDEFYEFLAHQDQPIDLPIPEVFGLDDSNWPWVRTDGLWGTIHAPRLFPYRVGAHYYVGQRMGVPAVPSYVMASPCRSTSRYCIMHFGYVSQEDRLTKHERYTSNPEGHASAHVQSILGPSQLERWDHPFFVEVNQWPVRWES